jgi:hypothetical protein
MNDWQIGMCLMKKNLPFRPDEPPKERPVWNDRRNYTPDELMLWRRMRDDGYAIADIARATGRTHSQINRAMRAEV